MLTNLIGSLFASGQKATALNPRPPMSFIIHVLVIEIKWKTKAISHSQKSSNIIEIEETPISPITHIQYMTSPIEKS